MARRKADAEVGDEKTGVPAAEPGARADFARKALAATAAQDEEHDEGDEHDEPEGAGEAGGRDSATADEPAPSALADEPRDEEADARDAAAIVRLALLAPLFLRHRRGGVITYEARRKAADRATRLGRSIAPRLARSMPRALFWVGAVADVAGDELDDLLAREAGAAG